ncbi:ATP-binding protein [Streptomyces sp. 2A115]|uniref:ATP-binding protein n=1 Tax=Streptomyces sp. 2A115 TaxID=3457439 RepID=UPI003FD65502
MTSLIQDPLLWISLLVFVAAIAAVMRARRTNLALRRENVALQSAHDAERARLYAEHTALSDVHAADVAAVRKDAEDTIKAVLKSAMRSLQLLADEQQFLIANAQKEHGDNPDVLSVLMQIDHANSQFGRRAQGIAVLCGGWLGRREMSTAPLYDVARSAQGRIKQFDRVNINSQVNVALASKAVEPVAVVLAELLANATRSSAPGTRVDINIQAVPTGVCLIVDDAGVGMSQEEMARSTALLSPQGPIDITSLGDPPKFGFAVSGMLATRYGFKVSVDSVSPYGGVRAVILLPESLLANDVPEPAGGAEMEESEAEAEAPAPQRLTPVATPAPPVQIGTTAGGLPKRRRRSSPVAVVPSPEGMEPEHNSEVTASRIGAFGRGTLRGRETTTTEGPQDQ